MTYTIIYVVNHSENERVTQYMLSLLGNEHFQLGSEHQKRKFNGLVTFLYILITGGVFQTQ